MLPELGVDHRGGGYSGGTVEGGENKGGLHYWIIDRKSERMEGGRNRMGRLHWVDYGGE